MTLRPSTEVPLERALEVRDVRLDGLEGEGKGLSPSDSRMRLRLGCCGLCRVLDGERVLSRSLSRLREWAERLDVEAELCLLELVELLDFDAEEPGEEWCDEP